MNYTGILNEEETHEFVIRVVGIRPHPRVKGDYIPFSKNIPVSGTGETYQAAINAATKLAHTASTKIGMPLLLTPIKHRPTKLVTTAIGGNSTRDTNTFLIKANPVRVGEFDKNTGVYSKVEKPINVNVLGTSKMESFDKKYVLDKIASLKHTSSILEQYISEGPILSKVGCRINQPF